jgi:SHS2 domain-containing protein
VSMASLLPSNGPVSLCGVPAQHWEHFDHAAGVGVRGFGTSRAAAFEQAALALTGLVADPGKVMPREAVPIWCEASDDELLLVEWLSAIVLEMASRRMLFGQFSVELADHRLTATAHGEHICEMWDAPAMAVDRVTYSGLRVARTNEGAWIAQGIADCRASIPF